MELFPNYLPFLRKQLDSMRWDSQTIMTGSLPANMGDSLLHLNVSNNPLLSGPLPSSVFSSSSRTPEWRATRKCQLDKTQLCIPPEWPYQPACIRDTSVSLKTCGGTSVPALHPTDPNAASQGSVWGGSAYSDLVVALFLTLLCLVFISTYLRKRRAAANQGDVADYDYGYYRGVPYTADGRRDNRDVEMQHRGEEANLPTYMPAAPEYSEPIQAPPPSPKPQQEPHSGKVVESK
ncbi:hypothetical protein BDR26DRAFT_854234 [Obelidium mucronatum]|nr:hypothetical protein BDR26DRAFT_854234 [Obelidium mucronatum]